MHRGYKARGKANVGARGYETFTHVSVSESKGYCILGNRDPTISSTILGSAICGSSYVSPKTSKAAPG